MATAKKSSTKKTVSKKRTVSAKTATKKTATKKVVAKKKPANTNMVTLEKLYKFNLFAAVSSILFAVLSLVFLSKDSVGLFLPHSTKDELASANETVLSPALNTLAEVEIRYILAVVFGLSAIFSLLLATKLRAKYEKGVNAKVSALRWVFIGITSALTLEVVSILGGVTDLVTLKLVAGLVLVTSILGWISEQQNKNGARNYGVFYVSLFTGALAWLPLVFGLIGTWLYASQNFGWHVYVLAAAVLIGFCSIARTQYRYIRDGARPATYLDYEGKYVSTDFLIRLATFFILFVALYK